MFNRTTFLIVLTIAAFSFATTTAAQHPTFDIPRLGDITIDGRPDDWADRGLRIDMLHPMGKPLQPIDDLNARFRLGYNEQGLLVLLFVNDDDWVESESDATLWAADGIEMYFATGWGEPDRCQWAIAPGMDAKQDDVRWKLYDSRNDHLKQGSADIIARRSKTADGYVMEILVPWSTFTITPAPGVHAAFQLRVNDADLDGGGTYRLGWHPGLQTTWDTRHMHRIRLADQPGAGQSLIFTQDYDIQRLQGQVIAWAQPSQNGKSLAITGDRQTLTQKPFTLGKEGFAQVQLPLFASSPGQVFQQLALNLDGREVAEIKLPYPGCLADIKAFLSQEQQLREQFGIDRPWDDMAAAPANIRRHRGQVAWALMAINGSNTPQAVSRIESLAFNAKMIAAINAGEDYLGKQRNEFWTACYNAADASGQPFIAAIPNDYDPKQSYPLMLRLHGGGGLRMPSDQPYTDSFISVRPWSRSRYRALDETHIMQIIDYMKTWYNIDPDRVYITGGSFGGWGTWTLATRNADTFAAAAPVFGYINDLPFENLVNVPVFNQHGMEDWAVSLDNSRYAIKQLQQLGYAVIHKEYPGKGHEKLSDFTADDWMLAQRRPKAPTRVVINCQIPEEGNSFWLKVQQFIDPHDQAQVDARVCGYSQEQSLTLRADNAAVLTLKVSAMPLDRSQTLHLQVNTTYLAVPQPLPEQMHIVKTGDAYTLQENWSPDKTDIRPYRPGAAANLFTGEPLLIVYGTTSEDSRRKNWQQVAEHIATQGGSNRRMALGRFPIKPDHQVTDDDLAQYNLVVLGGEKDNSITARMIDQLPISINESNELVAGNRQPVSLDQATFHLACYNPLAPKRLIYLIDMDDASTEQTMKWVTRDRGIMTGWFGIRRGEQPDLCVQTFDGKDRLMMQFADNWQWRQFDGLDQKVLPEFAHPEKLNEAILRVRRQAASADFAIGWPAGQDWDLRNYDFNFITRADLAVERLAHPTLVGQVTGGELIEIHERFIAKNEMTVYPDLQPQAIEPGQTYRLVLPISLCWELVECHKNLHDAQPGPRWRKQDLWRELFTEDQTDK